MFSSFCRSLGFAIGIESTAKKICECIPDYDLQLVPYEKHPYIKNIDKILEFFPKKLEDALLCNGYSYAEYQALDDRNKSRFKRVVAEHLYNRFGISQNEDDYSLNLLNNDDFKKSLIVAVGTFLIKDIVDSILKKIFDICNKAYHDNSLSFSRGSMYQIPEHFSRSLHHAMNQNYFSYTDYIKWNEDEKENFQEMIAKHFVEKYKDKTIYSTSSMKFWEFCPKAINTSLMNPEPLFERELKIPITTITKNLLWKSSRLFYVACEDKQSSFNFFPEEILKVIETYLKKVILFDSADHKNILVEKRNEVVIQKQHI